MLVYDELRKINVIERHCKTYAALDDDTIWYKNSKKNTLGCFGLNLTTHDQHNRIGLIANTQ